VSNDGSTGERNDERVEENVIERGSRDAVRLAVGFAAEALGVLGAVGLVGFVDGIDVRGD
jgi:hypothetical protein